MWVACRLPRVSGDRHHPDPVHSCPLRNLPVLPQPAHRPAKALLLHRSTLEHICHTVALMPASTSPALSSPEMSVVKSTSGTVARVLDSLMLTIIPATSGATTASKPFVRTTGGTATSTNSNVRRVMVSKMVPSSGSSGRLPPPAPLRAGRASPRRRQRCT